MANNEMEKSKLLKESLKIVDELGKLDPNDFDEDVDALDILKGLIKKAKELKEGRLWKL